jgi:hypothetical protein
MNETFDQHLDEAAVRGPATEVVLDRDRALECRTSRTERVEHCAT